MEWIPEADGVFRGGGVKGLGLAGALLGFAEHPTKAVTKWVNVAGTSAGAIIASYLACGHSAEEMEALMNRTKYAAFKDSGSPLGSFGAVPNLLFRRGAFRGKYFQDWFSDELGHATFKDVKTADGKRSRLKLITVDVANREMLVVPDDLCDAEGRPRYVDPKTRQELVPDELEIARGARMSMSIPYFFEPVELKRKDGKDAVLVDGATLSNFPVWLFDTDSQPPARPTFGFTMESSKRAPRGIAGRLPWAVQFGSEIAHTAMEAWDNRFVSHSTRVRTCVVDTGDVGLTEFNITPARRTMLIENGRKAGRAFLDDFDLDKYFNTFGQTFVGTDARSPVGAPA